MKTRIMMPLMEIIDPGGGGGEEKVNRVKFPESLKESDILSVHMRTSRGSKLFIISGVYPSNKDTAYGFFDDEFGDSPPRLLSSEDLLRVERVSRWSPGIESIIKERNELRKRIKRIEKNLADLIK